MDIFDRKKQGGVFGTCYAHKNIHYHDPKGSVFHILGNYIPNTGYISRQAYCKIRILCVQTANLVRGYP